MRTIIHELLGLSYKYDFGIVITNQIATINHNDKSINVPTLGLAWANLVNTRIILSKIEQNCDTINLVRKFEIKFSSYLGKSFCYYKITGNGIVNG